MITSRLAPPRGGGSTGGAQAPRWARSAGYMICGWSLMFAVLHFAAQAPWVLAAAEHQGPRPDPAAWWLCAAILCVVGAVAALAVAQFRTRRFPGWLVRASALAGAALVFGYVVFSFLTNGFHWALAPGVLCVVGALVGLALTQPWGGQLPRWLMLLFTWAGGLALTLHALYGFVVHGLVAVGAITWTQVQQWAGAPVVPMSAEAVGELILSSMLIWNPWFLLGGILFLIVAHSAGRRAPGHAPA